VIADHETALAYAQAVHESARGLQFFALFRD